MPEPPCFGPVHWRVVRNPIKVAPEQIVELERLVSTRIDPGTCKKYTAGKPRDQRKWKVSVNRPLQTVSPKHQLVYCECEDWRPKTDSDIEYCTKPMEERGVKKFIPTIKPTRN